MKHYMPLTLTLLLTAATTTFAADSAKVSGFADIWYTIADETADDPAPGSTAKNANEGKFLANAEVDIEDRLSEKVDARIDIEADLAINGGGSAGGDSGRIEQAFFVLKNTLGPINAIAGVFNNPIGWEAEDTPDMYQYSHGSIWGILDQQTVLTGNNIAGLAIQGTAGPATLTLAYLDDTYLTDEENSVAAILNLAPVKGLDIEIGYVTQADQGDSGNKNVDFNHPVLGIVPADTIYTGAENVVDANVTFTMVPGLTLALEYMSADEVVDNAVGLYANYAFLDGRLSVTGRYDKVTWADLNLTAGGTLTDLDDTTTTTVALNYKAAENLGVVLEYRDLDDGDRILNATGIEDALDDGSTTVLEFVATF